MHKSVGYTYKIPANSRFVTLFVFSEGGFVEVNTSQGYEVESRKYFVDRRSFRPETPSFSSFNRLIAGSMLLHIDDGTTVPKIVDLSFANVSPEAPVKVGFAVAFDGNAVANGADLQNRVEFDLQKNDTVSCHVVLTV